MTLDLPEEDSLNARPKKIQWTKKNISKIDNELDRLAQTVKSSIAIKDIEKMLQ